MGVDPLVTVQRALLGQVTQINQMFGRKHRIEELQIMLRYDPNNRQALDELRSLIMSPPQPTTNTTVSLNTNVEDGEDEVSAPAEVNAADEETAEVNAADERGNS